MFIFAYWVYKTKTNIQQARDIICLSNKVGQLFINNSGDLHLISSFSGPSSLSQRFCSNAQWWKTVKFHQCSLYLLAQKSFPNPPYGSEHRVDITESAQFPTGILILGCIRAEWKTRLKSYRLHNKWLSMSVFWQFDICNHISSSAGAGCSAEGALLWLTRQKWWAYEAAQLTHSLNILYYELWATFDFCCIICM